MIQDQEYFRETGKLVYNDTVKKNVEIMKNSSTCRIYLLKNVDTANWWDLLKSAVECIGDLTGDQAFRHQVLSAIDRRVSH